MRPDRSSAELDDGLGETIAAIEEEDIGCVESDMNLFWGYMRYLLLLSKTESKGNPADTEIQSLGIASKVQH